MRWARRQATYAAVAVVAAACGRAGYGRRDADADVADALIEAAAPCGATCLRAPTAPPVALEGTLSHEGNPISLAADDTTLFAAFTQPTASAFALHLAPLAPMPRRFDVVVDLSVAANDHALAVLPSGLALGYVRTTGTLAADTRLALLSPSTGAVLESVSIDTRSSTLRGLHAGRAGLGITWLRGTVDAPTASFFQLRDDALVPIGTTLTLPSELIPSALAQVGSDWFVGGASTSTMGASVVRIRDLMLTPLPAWPSACAGSAGVTMAVGCRGALVCWRDTSACGAVPEVVDRCALLAEDASLSTPVVLYGGAHPGEATAFALDAVWTGSEFYVHSEFADGERVAVLDSVGAVRIESEELTPESRGAQGDVAWSSGCAATAAFNDAGNFFLRRACAVGCP